MAIREAKKYELNWREIMDCKIAGDDIEKLAKIAYDIGYKYISHNGRVFEVRDGSDNGAYYADEPLIEIVH